MENYQNRQWATIKAGVAALKEAPYQTPRLQRLRGDLEAAHKKIDALFMTQLHESRVRSEGVMREQLRVKLRQGHLKPICKDARVLLDGLPGVKEFFHLPHKRTKNKELLEAADRILRHAEEHKAVFVKGRWAKDFIKKAEAAADALKAKLDDGDTVISRRSNATHSLGPALAKGREIMGSIDSAVNSELADNLPACRRWADAYRVPQTRGRPKNNRRARRIYPPPEE
jgi:hypothetical protein